MKTTGKKAYTALTILTVLTGLLLSNGCKKNDTPEPNKTVYNLKIKDMIGISGTVTFTETSSTVTTITIKLNGGSATNHPAHIHLNSAIETGAIALTLTPVDASGNSITEVSKLDDNTPINYSQLLNFDGYINVHESSSNLGTIIAQCDIGGNELTGAQKSYTLNAVNASGVSGTALFEKRKNGNTLVTLSMIGTVASGIHPAHIHLGSVASVGGGPIVKDLSNVEGATGKSYTNIRTLNDGTPITYDNWLVYDGYINVLNSQTISTVISQGNIGSNQ
jgi:hypothetical protein